MDTVLYFEGERGHPFRILRAHKNRFGSTNEIGVFEMKGAGLAEVADPSALFLAERPVGKSGSVVTSTLNGTRPLLVEVQALVAPTGYGTARRTAIGVDGNRVALLAAVLEKKEDVQLVGCDIFVNVAGGMQLTEPAVRPRGVRGAGLVACRTGRWTRTRWCWARWGWRARCARWGRWSRGWPRPRRWASSAWCSRRAAPAAGGASSCELVGVETLARSAGGDVRLTARTSVLGPQPGHVRHARGLREGGQVEEGLAAQRGDELGLDGVALRGHGLGGELIGLDEDEAAVSRETGAGTRGLASRRSAEEVHEGGTEDVAPGGSGEALAVVAHVEDPLGAKAVLGRHQAVVLALEVVIEPGLRDRGEPSSCMNFDALPQVGFAPTCLPGLHDRGHPGE